mgnify:FL=1
MAFTIYNVAYTENEAQLDALATHDGGKAFKDRPRKRGEMCYKHGIIYTVNNWHKTNTTIAKECKWFRENGKPMVGRVVHVRNLAREAGLVNKGLDIVRLMRQIDRIEKALAVKEQKALKMADKSDALENTDSVTLFKFRDMVDSLGKTKERLEQKQNALACLKVA